MKKKLIISFFALVLLLTAGINSYGCPYSEGSTWLICESDNIAEVIDIMYEFGCGDELQNGGLEIHYVFGYC